MTQYNHYYLRGNDAQEVETVLLAAGLMVESTDLEGEPAVFPAQKVHIHTVGKILEGGEWDSEGNVVVAPTELPGWHVNMCTEFPVDEEAIASILIPSPSNPHCIWSD
tara:strand:- start:175 stop:498 length:324 start_codon:yes stop_codon:yes gene_type:complete